MVCANSIACVEVRRSRLDERLQFFGVESARLAEETDRLDLELGAIERPLPDEYRFLNEPE